MITNQAPLPLFDKSVSLVCWAYNEEDLIEEFLNKASAILESSVKDYEIVLVDDGSTDNTFFIAESFRKKNPQLKIFRNEKNLNVGISSKRAIRYASKEYLFWQTIDWSYDISRLREYLRYLNEYAIVQGVRVQIKKPPASFFSPLFLLAALCSKQHLQDRSDSIGQALVSIINFLVIRVLFNIPCADFQNVTFYPTGWIQSIQLEASSSFVNPEGLIKSYWQGKSIKEVLVPFIPRSKGISKGVRVKTVARSIADIIYFWFKWIILGKRTYTKKGIIAGI